MLSGLRRGVVLALMFVTSAWLGSSRSAHADCGSPANAIEAENCLPGNPSSEWDLSGPGDSSIVGFATDISVNRGATVQFKVKTNASSYRIDIYRLGYYGGDGARKVATVSPSASLPQSQPTCLTNSTGLVDCGNWSVSASWAVPTSATSGIYVAKLVRSDTGGASHVVFVVRSDGGSSDILFQTSDTTWQAYNQYGGNSFYVGSGPGGGLSAVGRAYKVSYNRPFTTRDTSPEDWLFNAEYPMVRWLEHNGYDVTYFTGLDADRRGDEIARHKVYLAVGHDEYWSKQQRANVEKARDQLFAGQAAPVHLAFFSGNEIFWKTRWESSIDASATAYRTLVCYKETHEGAKIDPSSEWTGTWRDPRFSPPSDGGRPENALSGTIFMVNGEQWDSLVVPAAEGKMRFWRNTPNVSSLTGSQVWTGPVGTVGYEWDEDLDNGARPAGLVRLSSNTVSVAGRLLDYGSTFGPGTATHRAVFHKSASGALVFGAGTVQWSWGLDSEHDRGSTAPSVDMMQATVNLLADMGTQPATLQAGLLPESPSSDVVAPVSDITAPTNGATVPFSSVTIQGVATDGAPGRVGGIEVSVDGGLTWHPAEGLETWQYVWTPAATGSYTILSRAVDDSGNIESPGAGVAVVVGSATPPSGAVSIWGGGGSPALVNQNDGQPLELGVKFRSSTAGYVTALRYYKGSQDSGSHVGSLWTSSGTLLASATFSGGTSSGWQEVALATPVAILANTTYVASCYSSAGYYVATDGYFAQAYSNPPLTALADGVDGGNGVYRYGSSGFPDQTWGQANYWVDVVFNAQAAGPDTTPPTVLATTPASGEGETNVAVTTSVIATFSEALAPGTVSATTVQLRDAASQLVTGTVTWNGATNSAVLVPAVSLAYSTTYTATVKGGTGGVTDVAGNPLASDFVWTFTTGAQTPPPSGTVSIWGGGGSPDLVNQNDGQPLELGVKFRSSTAGYITALRYYKGSQDSGSHVGNLWTSSGTLLASATFSGGTSSGWQEVTLATPVAILANTTYVASCYSAGGYYVATSSYFTQGVTNAPLTALADGVDGANGVYRYGSSGFPTSAYLSSNYWVDVVFSSTAAADTTPPTVVTTTPANGTSGVLVSITLKATFSELLAAATVNGTTVQLVDPALQPVPASVTWDPGTNSAVIDPTSGLAYSTTYTATVKGGTAGVTDVAGNPLASDFTWSFTTQAPPPPPPGEGPGGPILVIGYAGNPFSRYYAEILRAEGLNAFQVLDISAVDAGVLSGYDVAILGEMPLTASQVTMLTDWVNAGGNLIAMRPDKKLAGLLGLTDSGTTLSQGYLLVNTGTSPGLGIVGQTMQFHGTADRYGLAAVTPAATTVATLYSTATTATSSPAVTLRSVGSSGGQAAAFTFDLARSIIYMRQGNPAWAGDERDGVSPVRSDDMFYGAKAGDNQKDWVDLTKVAIPQADEQQRLFANLILKMNADRKPLPRFWYFPFGKKAVVVMAVDNHGNPTVETRFEAEDAASPAGCSVDNWECVRSSVYLYLSALPDDTTAKMWQDKGFEVGLHVNTNCADWTPSTLPGFYTSQIADFFSKFPSLSPLTTHRTHCIAWSDWATQPKVELANGIRFDSNYYYWPPTWVNDTPGFFTGSGMPMRFADSDGSIIDVYQSTTQMTDESGQSYPATIDTLLDRALGSQGYYGAFDANIHSDGSTESQAAAIVDSAQTRGVPVVSAKQMLTWLDGRNGSSFQGITWNEGVLTFGIAVGAGANGLQAMLPTVDGASDPLYSLTRGGVPVTYSVQVVKGVEYAVFGASAGTYQATYGAPPPDTTPPVISAVSASGSGGTATVQWSTDEPATSLVRYGTSSANLTQQASSALLLTAHSLALSGLTSGTTYYYQVSSTDGAGNTSTSATSSFVEATETIPPTVVSTTPANGGTGVSVSTSVSAVFSEALAPATVNQTTVVLRDAASQVVPASVTWSSATSAAVLVPTASLAYSATYTATVKGGAAGVTDLVGNPLATDYVWTFTTQANDAVPAAGWFAGDMHVHRSCGGSPESISSVKQKMAVNDLAVISLLADMGNGEVQDPVQDLPRVTGADDPSSTSGRIVHWDAEWHWDATYTQYPHQALGGHIVALGLNQAQQVWEEYTYPIFQWIHQRNGIGGFAHFQYLGSGIPTTLDCCSPLEYPVEVALGSADFISEDVNGSDSFIQAYYRLLNSGFRPGFAAGTDYPCGTSEIGSPLTYVQVAGGQMTYRNWIEGIAAGRTVVSRNGQNEFLALNVNGTATPGDEIRLGQGGGSVSVTARWTAKENLSGTIELVENGVVVASQAASAGPGAPATLSTTVNFSKSGWLAARRMDASGHQVHTAAVFVIVNDLPIRTSVADAQFYVQWIDNLLTRTAPGGAWSSFFTTSGDAARARYQAAKQVYQQIAAEAAGDTTPPTVSLVSPVGGETVFQSSPYLIRWTASDDVGVTSIDVAFSSDGGATFAPVSGCTGLAGTAQSCSWSAPGPATTQGRIRVTARDAAGQTGVATSGANFTVIAGSPSITLTAPNTAVSWAIGSTQVITFNHNLGTGASVVIDMSRDGGSTWSTVNPSFVTTSATSGSYGWVVTAPATTTARARVTWAGNTAITSASAVSFTIADTVAPTVSVTAPTAGSTVSGTVSVTATASDDVGVAGVQFLLDGVALGAEDTASPYSVSWNTATASVGAHTLTARARDAAGNQTTSASVSVTVSAVVALPGLVAAYGFEEGAGSTTADSSGLSHTGTITAGTWSTAGRFGKALSFNGTSSVVTIADAADLRLASAMTVEAWVQPTSSSSWRCVLLKERSGGLTYALYSSEGSGRPNGYVRVGSDIDVTASSAITLNTWTHLAATYDGATFRLYVNGSQVTSRTLTGSITSSTQPLRIGGNSVWGEYFAGLIDEVRVYNRALSAAEIQTDMNMPVVP